jgi:hypothetical protein
MKTKITTILSLTIIAAMLAAFIPIRTVAADSLTGRGGPGGMGGGNTQGTGAGGLALTPLTAAEAADLQEAILEEYGALNLYTAIIAQFGSVVPFSQIAVSEQMHVNALVRQATKYGLTVPVNPGLTGPPQFADLAAACETGVAAEVADAALYDELMPATTHSDLLRVYEMLHSASLDSHLPAFKICQ